MLKYCYLSIGLSLWACHPEPLSHPADVSDTVSMTAYEISAAIRTGEISSEAVVGAYLDRIDAFDDQGPMIQSVIAINPNAMDDARQLDHEMREGQRRGPLHGVPVLIKDTIETRELPTTAGSLALRDNFTNRDAAIIANLREAGALILGKTNLSEWANFRSGPAIAGWSAVGGLTRNPHALDRSACGSSSGSAAAVAASFAPLALGTETNGSITCPAAVTGIVGFKPTVGLLSRRHIITVSPYQDSAGPMAKTVRDAALMLSVMAGSDESDPATGEADRRKVDYVAALEPDLDGLRIGVFRWAEGRNPNISVTFEDALSVLADQGAELVQIEAFEPDPVMFRSGEQVLHTEFKSSLNAYLAQTPAAVTVRSLDDLIAFNQDHAARELTLFDQSIFDSSRQSPGADDPDHLKTVQDIQTAARSNGIDALLSAHNVDVLVMPSAKPAAPIDITFSSRPAGGPIGAGWLAAMAGYPVLSVPMGEHMGLPLGLMIMGTAWDDATVLRVGHQFQINSGIDLRPSYADGPFETEDFGPLMRPASPSDGQ